MLSAPGAYAGGHGHSDIPPIALLKDQVDAIRAHCQDDSVAHFLNSSLGKHASNAVRKDVMEGRTKLLYVAPESLTKQVNVEFLQSSNVSFYAIDEALHLGMGS